ncbi:MAG: hypothetical protein E7411_00705 [Ruminococcaceae bacterium]|nr:hypothetical protein [Oscillospiraceae bacterium]
MTLKRVLSWVLILSFLFAGVVFADEMDTEAESSGVYEEELIPEDTEDDTLEEEEDRGDYDDIDIPEEKPDASVTEPDTSEEEVKPSEPQEPVKVVKGKYNLLAVLDIIPAPDSFTDQKVITRGELMMYFSKISGVDGISKSGYTGKFTDVNSETPYCTHIQAMENLGVINGTGTGSFFPADKVTVTDAVAAATKLLGYDIYAETMGGYPTGYYSAANQAGITKGMEASSDGYLYGKNAVTLLFNMLTTELKVQSVWGNEESIKVTNGSCYLETVFNVFEGKGLADGNEFTGLRKVTKTVNEECISIDGVMYKAPGMDTNAELGKKLRFFYRQDDGSYIIPEILYYEADASVEVTNLDAGDIISVDNYNITYLDEQGREEKLKFSGVSDVIYNFKTHPEFSYDDISIDMGTVTLIDNDGNGTYDVLNILSYAEYMIESVNKIDEVITADNGKKITLPGDNNCTIYQMGRKITLEDVYSGTVINVLASDDNLYMIIYVNAGSVNGTVREVSIDDGITRIKIDETVYELSPLAKYIPRTGDYGAFYLNHFGQIAAKDKVVTDEQYAYLINKGDINTYEERYFVKLVNESGKVINYELAPKVKFNDNPRTEARNVINNPLLMNGVLDEDGNPTCQQLIKFKTDKDGKLNLIRVFTDYTDKGEDFKKDKADTTFTLDYKSDVNLKYYGGNAKVFGTRFLVNAETHIFFAPPAHTTDVESFDAGLITKLATETTYTTPEFYDVAYSNMTGVVVIRQAAGAASSMKNGDPELVISNITRCYIPEEDAVGLRIYGYRLGLEKEFLVKDLSITDNNSNYGNGKGVLDLRPGDVIQYALNTDGSLAAIKIIFQYNPDKFELTESHTSTTSVFVALHQGIAQLLYRDEASVILNATDVKKRIHDRSFIIGPRTRFFRFDTKKNRLTMVEATDIPENAKVYFRNCYNMLYDVIYFE